MFREIIKKTLSRRGYETRAIPAPIYAEQGDFDADAQIVRSNTMLPDARLRSLYEQTRFCNAKAIEGAFVECGVWKGGAVGLMALASKRDGAPRALHLFDSFTDICEPDATVDGRRALEEAGDISNAGGKLKPIEGFYNEVGGHGTLADCKSLIENRIGYAPDLVHYHVGWFQDTMPLAASTIGPIAVLRIDGDWYSSTKVCLDELFDLVVPSGFVIIDDYGTYEGCKLAVDEFLENNRLKAFLQPADKGCYYFIKPAVVR